MEPIESLALVYDGAWPSQVESTLFGPPDRGESIDARVGFDALRDGAYEPPKNLIPLMIIDDDSLACMVGPDSDIAGTEYGDVIRWFLSGVDLPAQGRLLDIDPLLFVASMAAELDSRDEGLSRILDVIGPAYLTSHIANDKRPRDYVVRPLRIACQNVIVGLAAIAQDASFDGLSVIAWQTCEVPHVSTHEANRALAALTLCDAFQNGGTMEIRFDRPARLSVNGKQVVCDGHPERAVPASLRRFGRTVGVLLGAEDPAAITPAEARELFLAITPMPAGLRSRVDYWMTQRGISPERICFCLLSQIWREVELDFIFAASSRARSILEGGAPWTDRASRQAESQVCREAVMTGMLFRRLNSNDAASASVSEVRVVEDRFKGVTWEVDEANGSVTFRGIDKSSLLPWTHVRLGTEEVTVFPRSALTTDALDMVRAQPRTGVHAILIPRDAPAPEDSADMIVLRCPERLADIDKDIERRLLTSRISRG